MASAHCLYSEGASATSHLLISSLPRASNCRNTRHVVNQVPFVAAWPVWEQKEHVDCTRHSEHGEAARLMSLVVMVGVSTCDALAAQAVLEGGHWPRSRKRRRSKGQQYAVCSRETAERQCVSVQASQPQRQVWS